MVSRASLSATLPPTIPERGGRLVTSSSGHSTAGPRFTMEQKQAAQVRGGGGGGLGGGSCDGRSFTGAGNFTALGGAGASGSLRRRAAASAATSAAAAAAATAAATGRAVFFSLFLFFLSFFLSFFFFGLPDPPYWRGRASAAAEASLRRRRSRNLTEPGPSGPLPRGAPPRVAQPTGLAGARRCRLSPGRRPPQPPVLRSAPGARSKPQQSDQAPSGDRGGDQGKVKPPLQEEEQEEVTQEKRTARSPFEASESPGPRGEGGRGPPPPAEEEEEAAAATAAAAGRARRAANSDAPCAAPSSSRLQSFDTLCRPSPLGLGCAQGRPCPGTE
ncbi:cuticle collagen 40-like [Suricata suricatta]|uniref:cuticle collagen 40-like n=1 Tax=Suricata suricatta TaxID=37032 RepID=UPI001155AB96|nr:cuticle collagen 40-like [Suricata suricatta]